MHGGFGFLEEFFHRKDHGGVVQVLEMSDDASELRFGVIAQGGGDDDLMATDGDLHDEILSMLELVKSARQ